MLKAINFRRIGSVGFRSAVFLLLLCLVFYKLREVSFAGIEKVADTGLFFLPLILLATVLNQYCEFRKWKALANALDVDSKELVKSYFDGLTVGFLTPNGWGTFLGRMVHVEKQQRADLVIGTALSNAAQFLPTLFFGGLALTVVQKFPPFAGTLTVAAALILTIAYALSEKATPLLRRLKIVAKTGSFSNRPFEVKWQLLAWSSARYGTFLMQYALFFHLFGYYDYTAFAPNIAALFILTSIVPSLWSGKVLIREAAAIFLFTDTGFPLGDVVLICLLVWLSNVILPVVFGAVRNLVFAQKTAVHALD